MDETSPDDEVRCKRGFRAQWLSAIEHFADTNIQNTRWTNPRERNPAYTLEECVLDYFENSYHPFRPGEGEQGYDQLIARGFVSQAEVDAVLDFHRVAEAYRPPNDDWFDGPTIVADTGWRAVVAEAQAAQEKLLRLLTDPRERRLLSEPLDWEVLGKDGFQTNYFGTFTDS